MASIETASMKPLDLKSLFTTRYEMIIERIAVMGAATSDNRNESRKAWKPWYLVKTCWNHLVVSEKS